MQLHVNSLILMLKLANLTTTRNRQKLHYYKRLRDAHQHDKSQFGEKNICNFDSLGLERKVQGVPEYLTPFKINVK